MGVKGLAALRAAVRVSLQVYCRDGEAVLILVSFEKRARRKDKSKLRCVLSSGVATGLQCYSLPTEVPRRSPDVRSRQGSAAAADSAVQVAADKTNRAAATDAFSARSAAELHRDLWVSFSASSMAAADKAAKDAAINAQSDTACRVAQWFAQSLVHWMEWNARQQAFSQTGSRQLGSSC